MIDLNDYFSPVSIVKPEYEYLSDQAGFPHNITIHTESFPIRELSRYKIALMGVPEGRNSPSTGTMKAPDTIREELYRLTRIPGKSKIIDLGNMKNGVTFNDTVSGLKDILTCLTDENIFPVIIGGSSALVISIDKALSDLKLNYTLSSVDSRIDYINDKKEPDSAVAGACTRTRRRPSCAHPACENQGQRHNNRHAGNGADFILAR